MPEDPYYTAYEKADLICRRQLMIKGIDYHNGPQTFINPPCHFVAKRLVGKRHPEEIRTNDHTISLIIIGEVLEESNHMFWAVAKVVFWGQVWKRGSMILDV